MLKIIKKNNKKKKVNIDEEINNKINKAKIENINEKNSKIIIQKIRPKNKTIDKLMKKIIIK